MDPEGQRRVGAERRWRRALGVGSGVGMGERGSGAVEGAVAARDPRRLTGPEAGSGAGAGPRPTDGGVAA